MSNTQFAFLVPSRLPTRTEIQDSIDALGFDLTLSEDVDLATHVGFLPCVLDGIPGSGFEFFVEPAANIANGDEELMRKIGGRDLCASMVWRGSMRDCACAMIVGCALARDCDAVISYEGEPPSPLEVLIAETVAIVHEVRRGAV